MCCKGATTINNCVKSQLVQISEFDQYLSRITKEDDHALLGVYHSD